MGRQIVVLQMGKVASWTTIKTIQAVSPNTILCDLERSLNERDAIVHLHEPRAFKRYLRDTIGHKRDIVVVTLVRDPLRTAIAKLFQNITNADSPQLHYGDKAQVNEASGRDLVDFFRDMSRDDILAHYEEYTRRYGSALGIDAFDLNYDANGVAEGAFSRGRYIVLRVHRLTEALPRLSKVLSLDIKTLALANLATEKWYAPAYERFLASFTPTSEEISAFYSSRFAQTNFSAEDLHDFVCSWQVGAREAAA